MRTVRVYLTVFLIVTSTGRVLGRVIAYVTQYVPYHTLCKSQYMLTPLSRAWSVAITFNHNYMSVSTVRVVHIRMPESSASSLSAKVLSCSCASKRLWKGTICNLR